MQEAKAIFLSKLKEYNIVSNGLLRWEIDIDTQLFAGTPDKPYDKDLCDSDYFYIEIIGTMQDDIKSHIIQ